MIMHLDYAIYNAFSPIPYGGSPAALVADADSLSAEQMQRMAVEFGAPATGFITGFDGETVNVRFFSTRTEYPMCGHGTIALASWLVEQGAISPDTGCHTALTLKTPASSARLEVWMRETGMTESRLTLQPAEIGEFNDEPGDVCEP